MAKELEMSKLHKWDRSPLGEDIESILAYGLYSIATFGNMTDRSLTGSDAEFLRQCAFNTLLHLTPNEIIKRPAFEQGPTGRKYQVVIVDQEGRKYPAGFIAGPSPDRAAETIAQRADWWQDGQRNPNI